MAAITKKPLGGNRKSQIRSPTIKRSPSSPVILQGWLHKQGSDGLMLWKKRWFVLADYCLFYYKGPAEEKLLGSFLLASYKISPCSSEDKIYRKYSFKAEHANMRTYYFSAENQASMIQWINALSLASILQENHSDSIENNRVKCWLGCDPQPLYANAPPKPRRITESPESSRVPDDGPNLSLSQAEHIDFHFNVTPPYIPAQTYLNQKQVGNCYLPLKLTNTSVYSSPPPPISSDPFVAKNLAFSQYSGHRPFYIDKSNSVSRNICPPRPHSADFLEHDMKEQTQVYYEKGSNSFNNVAKLQRPKSSLDVIRTSDCSYDSVHWSEESYAAKMRQTSLYVTPHFQSPDGKNGVPFYKSPKDKIINHNNAYNSSQLQPKTIRPSETSTDGSNKFIRSASARFPRQTKSDFNEDISDESSSKYTKRRNSDESRDSISAHEKEESMKRLLVWKQRMLQSPLTRKSIGSAAHTLARPELASKEIYKQIPHGSCRLMDEDNSERNSSRERSFIPNDYKCQNVTESEIRRDGATRKLSEAGPQTYSTNTARSRSRIQDCRSSNHSYNSLSSDDDEFLRLTGRDGRKHPRKVPSSKRSGIKSEDDSLVLEKNDSIGPKPAYNRNSYKSQYDHATIPRSKSAGTPEEVDLLGGSSKFINTDNLSSYESSNKDFSDSVNKVITDDSVSRKKHTDSGYSTLQNGIIAKESKEKSLSIASPSKSYSNNSYNNEACESEWGLKIDESRVIKEFSYHYINPNIDDNSRTRVDDNSLQLQTVDVIRQSEENFSTVNTDIREPGQLNQLKDQHLNIYSIQGYDSEEHLDRAETNYLSNEQKNLIMPSAYGTNSQSFPTFNKENIVSSDEDRDEEVAAVLSNHDSLLYNSEDQSNESLKSVIVTKPLDLPKSRDGLFLSDSNCLSFSPSTSLEVEIKEEHYMPMTPKKKSLMSPVSDIISHSHNDSNSHSFSLDNVEPEIEESSYVEMSHNTTSGSQSGSRTFSINGNESMVTCAPDSQSFDKFTHYEFISKTAIPQEPVYVEVSTLFSGSKNIPDEGKEDANKGLNAAVKGEDVYYSSLKPSLPDILNSSSTSRSHVSTKSDSSDADDEASKDLESLSAPKHPRFSLSDTFRPASYYLGANHCDRSLVGLNSEQQDSSDSDLVSPPPIPSCPPPGDDLDLSLETIKKSKSKSSKETRKNQSNDNSNQFWKLSDDNNYKKLLNSSLSRRHLEDLSSETDSVDSMRKEQLLKRRPFSADILDNLSESHFLSSSPSSGRKSTGSDLDSVGYRDESCINYDHYLEDLQVNDRFLESLVKNTNDHSENFLRCKQSNPESGSSDPVLKINNVIWDYERKKNELPSELLVDNFCEKYFRQAKDIPPNLSSQHTLAANGSNASSVKGQTGAPYYYSDILKVGDRNHSIYQVDQIASVPEMGQMLNNNKATGLKNNLINHSYTAKMDNHSKQFPKSNVNISSTDETVNNPNKNLFKAGTSGKQNKKLSDKFLTRSQTPDFHKKKKPFHDSRNYSSNSNNFDTNIELNLQRRSRSFEGLLDEGEYVKVESRPLRVSPGNAIFKLLQTTQPQSKNLSQSSSKSTNVVGPDTFFSPSSGNSNWPSGSDSLLENSKESILRHSRSLDDLDWCTDSQNLNHTGEEIKPVGFSPTQILSQENSMSIPEIPGSSEQNLSEQQVEKNGSISNGNMSHSIDPDAKKTNINEDASESGAKPDGEFGTPVQVSHPSSFEIDREKLRQWDSMSSAPSGMLSATRSLAEKQALGRHQTPTPSSSPGCSGSGAIAVPSSFQKGVPSYNTGENWNLELSAGELLGRTHEELVLLLIQLRRRSSGLGKAIDDCQKEINAKTKLMDQDPLKKMELTHKIDELKRQLLDLEKQYEKGKPLVNLVDNMVKLGSLYHGSVNTANIIPERIEFNQKVQEQRLLAEEKKDWERLCPDHNQLQAKVEQLYKLDQLLQEESGTLQSLQQDKEVLEQALGGLKHKLVAMHGNPVETEQCRRQQRMLEKELSRVRSVLAQNSKKLEETVAENARLEQELVILRQKLQFSRRSAEPGSATATLESELKRVQDLVGDLQRQRQELCLQVRQLTEKSNSLSLQIQPGSMEISRVGATQNKRRPSTSWVETDLDSQITQDVGIESHDFNVTSGYTSGDNTKNMCTIHKEKPQEIKTVRIVKRESERRQRDRDRSGALGIPLINTISKRGTIIEETVGSESYNQESNTDNDSEVKDQTWNQNISACSTPPLPGPRSDSVNVVKNFVNKHKRLKEEILVTKIITNEESSNDNYQSSDELSPVYLSKAAQEIVEEVAWRKKENRRLIPKEKRRHHTVSGQSIFQDLSPFTPGGSRDDLDMERALRTRIHTPDVVRSTLSRDTKFTAETIDNALGTPDKIFIPERYIPENEPQFSKEEQLQRFKKAESIRKMLTQSTTITSESTEFVDKEECLNLSLKNKFAEEKRQREHLLQLNQILAQQVIEKSKIVAVTALSSISPQSSTLDSDSDSSEEPLPLFQQRENYFS